MLKKYACLLVLGVLFVGQITQAHVCDPYRTQSELNPAKPYELPLAVLLHYRQTIPFSQDYLGDIGLVRYALNAPYGLYWTLTGQQAAFDNFKSVIMAGKPCALELFNLQDRRHPELVSNYKRETPEREIRAIQNLSVSTAKREALLKKLQAGQLYFVGKQNPLRVQGFLNMINQIIAEEHQYNNILPKEGAIVGWSSRILSSKDPLTQGVIRFPKLLVALTLGETSRYLVTGQETMLLGWLLSQNIRSVEPADLFRISYRLNNGDITATLLTIENILSRFWKEENRAQLDQTLRLVPIVNEYGGDGDVYGTWYHLFGIILYSYDQNGVFGKVVGEVENVGSLILAGFESEKGENFINRYGSVVGGRLRASLRNQDWKRVSRILNYSHINSYINLNEDFSQQLKGTFTP